MSHTVTKINDTLFVLRMAMLFYGFTLLVLVLKIIENGGFN